MCSLQTMITEKGNKKHFCLQYFLIPLKLLEMKGTVEATLWHCDVLLINAAVLITHESHERQQQTKV